MKEQADILKVSGILDQLKTLFDIFNAPSLIHMKYMNLQMYTIKRLHYLGGKPEDYNPEGSGRDFVYQGSLWNEGFPSDPEMISSIFCYLLDAAYYGQIPLQEWGKKTYMINHLISYS